MPKKVSLNLLPPVFALAFLFAASAAAQTSSCPVEMTVVRSDNETKINGAAATAVNTKTKRVYKSVLKNGTPRFAKLADGPYRITVSKVGFKQSVDDFYLTCSLMLNGDYDWSIKLYKGSARQIVRLYNNRPNKYMAAPLKTAEVNKYSVVDPNENSVPGATYSDRDVTNVPRKGRIIEGGVINGKATNLAKPPYPAAARAVRASGAVNVQVTIDEQGNVISAEAISGHPLLRAAAVKAARESTFSPTYLSGQPVKVTGVIVYNFVP